MMKKIVILFTILLSPGLHAQTFVSGGIFSNTTWTLANSPYVANNVVVFPNVTLTIEPGVVVTVLNDLEIRQAHLIALGTSADSITFRSDTLSPITLYLNGAYPMQLNYCHFTNALNEPSPSRGISLYCNMNSLTDTCAVHHCTFSDNTTGAYFSSGVLTVDSCVFRNNGTGTDQSTMTITNSEFRHNVNAILLAQNATIQNCLIDSNTSYGVECFGGANVLNCHVTDNGIGIISHSGGEFNTQIHHNDIENNGIGIQLANPFGPDSIFCNIICGNTIYNVKNTNSYARNVASNYWCGSDSATVAGTIYDAYDDVSLGIVTYMPMDDGSCATVTGIAAHHEAISSFGMYPNPAFNDLTIELPKEISRADVRIYNPEGQLCLSIETTSSVTHVNVENLSAGLYFVELQSSGKVMREKFVKE